MIEEIKNYLEKARDDIDKEIDSLTEAVVLIGARQEELDKSKGVIIDLQDKIELGFK